jgi:hypothetical protein
MNLGFPGHVIDILEAGSLDAGAGDVVLPMHDNVRALCEIRGIGPMTLAGANDPQSADISTRPTPAGIPRP